MLSNSERKVDAILPNNNEKGVNHLKQARLYFFIAKIVNYFVPKKG